MALMAAPGRTLRCRGNAEEVMQVITDTFVESGLKLKSRPGEHPVRLRHGSETLGLFGTGSELLMPLLAIPGLRKRAFPFEVRVESRPSHDGECAIRVDARSTSSSSAFITKQFGALLDSVVDLLRERGTLIESGPLTDSATER